MGKDSANQDLSTPSPEKKAKLSERLQAYVARKHQERKLKEAQVSKIKEAQANARIAQGPRQRSVQEPPPIWGPRFPLDASSESLNTNEGPPLHAPLGHPSGIVSPDDGKNQRLYRVDPNVIDVMEALEQELGPHDFWNRILGVNPQGRMNRLHKKLPSNRLLLRQFQKVRQRISFA